MIYKPSPYEQRNMLGDIEYSLIEIMLKDKSLFQKFKLTSDMFYDPNLKKIIDYAESVNDMDAMDLLSKSKTDENFVTKAFMENLTLRNQDFVYNFMPYQRKLLHAYKVKKIRELSRELGKVSKQEDIDDITNQIQSYKDMTVETVDRTDEIAEEAKQKLMRDDVLADYAQTGLQNVDDMIKGMKKKTLNIIGANPSAGKSAFALNLMWNMAKAGHHVTFLSLEMDGVDIFNRIASRVLKIPSIKIRDKKISQKQFDKIVQIYGALSRNKNFRVVDNVGITTKDVRAYASEETDTNRVIFIDHLGLMTSLNKRLDRRLQIAEITRELKLIAKETNSVIILLAQLSRGNTKREDKRPNMSDLQESGNIEQDADNIFLLHRDDYHNKDENPTISETQVIIAKNREGETGTAITAFDKGIQTFYDYQ